MALKNYISEAPRELVAALDNLLAAVVVLPLFVFKIRLTTTFLEPSGVTYAGELVSSSGGITLDSTEFVSVTDFSGYVLFTLTINTPVPDDNRAITYGITKELEGGSGGVDLNPFTTAIISINGAGDNTLSIGLPVDTNSFQAPGSDDLILGITVKLYELPSV